MSTGNLSVGLNRSIRPESITVLVSRAALLGLTLLFGAMTLFGSLPSLETQMVIYLVGMVALNLPHGGYEHFSNLRYRGLPFGSKYVLLYITAIAAFIALFLIVPLIALAIAFATAVAKGGHGDLRVMDAVVGSSHLQSRLQRSLAAFVRGGAVMIVPLYFFPDTYYMFSAYMLAMFDPGLSSALWASMETSRPLLAGLYAVAVLTHLGWGLVTAGVSSSWLADLGETSLLVGFFAIVPVVVSIGLYFPLWYSMRQSGRSAYVHRETADEDDGLPVPVVWGTFIVGAFATGIMAALLWTIAPNPLGNAGLLPGLVAFYTIFICIVALPHVVVGEWLDVDRGIWYVP